ncbi:2Fe-2S iron-sulfur cluster-binding protein [Bradyrhizobium erythrophlei]|jgi:2Fe-2S ferredoxin|uniref:Ferredoxin, 2Fe-2S n=1 Tax=Bradyrhizobium erythrophlei TaxID=1437360 RepID=A0A1M5RFP3_9BRAD|nr:2Fe-2S iron-sulfur cluster-binding protein [Bradyrhizobium erythrophlei]SHH24563.1 ferredoxin, 2Fe-2S [Bradyrhizobium erythrophlei]
MPTITFIHPDGCAESVEAELGDSAMRAAIVHGIDGIVAECGGSLVCATCHVYVDDAWIGRVGPVGDDEDELLAGAAAERRAGSRLSCQIKITPELDGLVLRLPERQV